MERQPDRRRPQLPWPRRASGCRPWERVARFGEYVQIALPPSRFSKRWDARPFIAVKSGRVSRKNLQQHDSGHHDDCRIRTICVGREARSVTRSAVQCRFHIVRPMLGADDLLPCTTPRAEFTREPRLSPWCTRRHDAEGSSFGSRSVAGCRRENASWRACGRYFRGIRRRRLCGKGLLFLPWLYWSHMLRGGTFDIGHRAGKRG
jgi:hypothetical protein